MFLSRNEGFGIYDTELLCLGTSAVVVVAVVRSEIIGGTCCRSHKTPRRQ
uniref:Uncharacterized protein n=1 Tax=Rhizophora mucronata TaxID=61149 RepID=A0A2P2N1S5_RHIMU